MRDIIDIGVVTPVSLEKFFSSCYFGDDTEGSSTMVLTEDAVQRWGKEGGELIEKIVQKQRRRKVRRTHCVSPEEMEESPTPE